MIEVKIPKLGESIASAEVLQLYVSAGDHVDADQPIAELETDKASVDVPCPQSGVVEEILVSSGDEVSEGDLVLRLRDEDESRDESPAEDTQEAKSSSDEKTSEKKTSEEKTSKETTSGSAKASKKESSAKKEGTKKAEGADDSGEEDPEEQQARSQDAESETAEAERQNESDDVDAKTSADEDDSSKEEDDSKEEDGEASMKADAVGGDEKKKTKNKKQDAETGDKGPAKEEGIERRRMSRLARAAAKNLTRAWNEIPHVTHTDWAEVTRLMELRAETAEPPSLNALFARAVCIALAEHPYLNASLDTEHEEVLLKSDVGLGLAVDTEFGLVVPVIRKAQERTVYELAEAMKAMAKRARSGKLSPDDMQDGSFTITNVGSIGGLFFTPIIRHPEVAILGIGSLEERDGKQRIPLSLSYDHRVINGAEAARFTRRFAELIRNPLLLAASA